MTSPKDSINNQRRGFTLIEVMVSLGLLTVLGAIGLIMGLDFFRGYEFRYSQDSLVSILEKARSAAMANVNETAHGVAIASGSYTLFEGLSYASRNVARDQEFRVESAIMFSGPTEIVFDQLSGRVDFPGTIIAQNRGRTIIFTVTHEGSIIY